MKKVFVLVLMSFLSSLALATSQVTEEQALAVMDKYTEYLFLTGTYPPLYTRLVVGVAIGKCPSQSAGLHIRVYTEPSQVEILRYLMAPKIEGVPTCILSVHDAYVN